MQHVELSAPSREFLLVENRRPLVLGVRARPRSSGTRFVHRGMERKGVPLVDNGRPRSTIGRPAILRESSARLNNRSMSCSPISGLCRMLEDCTLCLGIQCFNGIEAGGLPRRIDAENEAGP